MTSKKIVMMTCALGALSASGVAWGQASEGIGDVIVTAQKRAANVQDTPIAITAVSQNTLVRQGVKDLVDISRVAPEVSVGVFGPINVLGIRGLRTGQFGPTVDSPNAIHLDGNYLARFVGLNGLFYDLERVEVLGGPQGTLYGRNSVGGAMNVITHKADLGKFGGFLSADIGNFNSMILQGAINVPITDDLAVRVSGYRNRRDGYYTDTNASNVDLDGYRLNVKYKPTDRDTLILGGDWQHTGGKASGTAPITKVYKQPSLVTVLTPGAPTAGSPTPPGVGSVSLTCPSNPAMGGNPGTICSAPTVAPILITDDIRHNANVSAADYGYQDISADGFNFVWDHDLDFATLTTQGSWRTMDLAVTAGQIGGAAQDARLKASGVLGPMIGVPGLALNRAASEWNSQEVRLTSNDADQTTLKYTVGVNHFNEKTLRNLGPADPYASWYANNTAAQPGTIIGSLVVPTPLIRVGTGSTENSLWTDSFAVFGEATYTPPAWEALHVTLGARYNWETKHGISESYLRSTPGLAVNYAPYNGQVVCAGGTPLPACPLQIVRYTQFDEERDFERATYKGSVAYDITDANMVYATYSTGYVSGGYAFGVPQTGDVAGNDHSYNPMSIESVELGTKNRFFDNRVQVNASIYHYDFTNYLTNQTIRVPDPLQTQLKYSNYVTAANAGATEFQGGTFDVTALVTEQDVFHVNAQYTEADVQFNLSDLYFKSMKAFLQSQNLSSTDACTLAAMVGPVCPDLQTYLGSNSPSYPGSAYPADFNPSGSFERPRWTINADYTHTFTVPDGTVDAQVVYHYTSRQSGINGVIVPPVNVSPVVPAGFTNLLDINARFPAKDTWDMSFRYQRDSANWSITAYVRNVLDTDNLINRTLTANPPGAASINLDTAQLASATGAVSNANYAFLTESYDPPRTFGIVFQANF